MSVGSLVGDEEVGGLWMSGWCDEPRPGGGCKSGRLGS